MTGLFNQAGHTAGVLMIIAMTIIVAILVRYVIVFFVQRWLAQKSFWPVDLHIGRIIFPALFLLLLSLSLLFVLPFLNLPKSWTPHINVGLTFFITLMVTWNISRMLKVVHLVVFSQSENSLPDIRQRAMRTQYQFVEKILMALVWLVGVSLAMMAFEDIRKIGASLLASAGLASMVIGFAAQKSLSNLIAGFQVAFTQPIRIGDKIKVQGEVGIVHEITLTYVVLKIWDERNLVLPISYFNDNPFENWTRESGDLSGTVFLYVAYGFPVQALREELKRLLQDEDLWDGRKAQIDVTNAQPESMELRVAVSSTDSGKLWDLTCKLRENLITYLQKHHSDYLPTQRVLHLEKA